MYASTQVYVPALLCSYETSWSRQLIETLVLTGSAAAALLGSQLAALLLATGWQLCRGFTWFEAYWMYSGAATP
jgi:hypothetical protein